MSRFSTGLLLVVFTFCTLVLSAQIENTNQNKFRQLYQELPTPNNYRTASGAPGHEYWQQKADYEMDIRLDDENQRVYGVEKVTYYNNSPDYLEYLWLQLDQNVRKKDNVRAQIRQTEIDDAVSMRDLKSILGQDFDGGFKIDYVKDASGNPLQTATVNTMMRINLPKPLGPGETYEFEIKWWYNIQDRAQLGGRSGYEYFEENDNYLYTIAQFFPRMAVYIDNEGWQNKQFLGRGEFTLTFGDYDVKITVPEDHYVSSTGVLQNEKEVLSAKEIKKFEEARTAFEEPVVIVSEEFARKKRKK